MSVELSIEDFQSRDGSHLSSSCEELDLPPQARDQDQQLILHNKYKPVPTSNQLTMRFNSTQELELSSPTWQMQRLQPTPHVYASLSQLTERSEYAQLRVSSDINNSTCAVANACPSRKLKHHDVNTDNPMCTANTSAGPDDPLEINWHNSTTDTTGGPHRHPEKPARAATVGCRGYRAASFVSVALLFLLCAVMSSVALVLSILTSLGFQFYSQKECVFLAGIITIMCVCVYALIIITLPCSPNTPATSPPNTPATIPPNTTATSPTPGITSTLDTKVCMTLSVCVLVCKC